MLSLEILEKAARKFCEDTGKDPNAPFYFMDDNGNEQTMLNWQAATTAIEEHMAAHNAIVHALGPKSTPLPPMPRKRIHIVPDNSNGKKLRGR